jgi:hypothetical protein
MYCEDRFKGRQISLAVETNEEQRKISEQNASSVSASYTLEPNLSAHHSTLLFLYQNRLFNGDRAPSFVRQV